jgi:hypothetical protein
MRLGKTPPARRSVTVVSATVLTAAPAMAGASAPAGAEPVKAPVPPSPGRPTRHTRTASNSACERYPASAWNRTRSLSTSRSPQSAVQRPHECNSNSRIRPALLRPPTCRRCGYLLLPNGARGNVTLSLGSCAEIGDCRASGNATALVAMAVANLTTRLQPPWSSRATRCYAMATASRRFPCSATSPTPVHWQKKHPPCPAKGVLGEDQQACVDFVQSTRHEGDLYSYLLFAHDARASHP